MRVDVPALLLVLACSSSSVALAQPGDNDGCTNGTLFGDYAFRVDGQLLPPGAPPVAREGVAMTHFDGAGGLTQVDIVMSNGVPLAGPADAATLLSRELRLRASKAPGIVNAPDTASFTPAIRPLSRLRRMSPPSIH